MRNYFLQITKGKGLRIPHYGFRIPDSGFRIPDSRFHTFPNTTKTWRTVITKLTFTALSPFFVELEP